MGLEKLLPQNKSQESGALMSAKSAIDRASRRKTMPSEEPAAKKSVRKTKKKIAKKTTAKKRKATKPVPKLRVRQVKSGIGQTGSTRRTLVALGIRHHQGEAVVNDSPSVRGMLRKVHHLVTVRPEESNV